MDTTRLQESLDKVPITIYQEFERPNDAPPAFQFKYNYKFPFLTVIQGVLNKHTWEPRTQLSTFNEVTQPSEDEVVFYRKQEHAVHNVGEFAYEKITINRATKEFKTEKIDIGVNGYDRVQLRDIYKTDGEDQVKLDRLIHHHMF